MTHRLCFIHQIDPRGSKVGGIETHVRQVVQYAPEDLEILIVGVDGRGDLTLGEMTSVTFEGRQIDFLPVVQHPEATITQAASKLGRSMTLRMALGALRHQFKIRKWLKEAPSSIEIERVEYAFPAWCIGRPTVLFIHSDTTSPHSDNSLLKRYAKLHATAEKFAVQKCKAIFCVNEEITQRLLTTYGQHQPDLDKRVRMQTVAVDTGVFRPTPFATDGVFRMMYLGRLDDYKDPESMMEVVGKLHQRMGNAFEFHYAGAEDLTRFSGYETAKAAITHHGILDQQAIRALMEHCHAVLFTSHMEGTPCLLLESIASGRAAAAFALSAFDPLIRPGLSGVQVERVPDREKSLNDLANAAFTLWQKICDGTLDPHQIAELAKPYSVAEQLEGLFQTHRAIAQKRFHELATKADKVEQNS